MAVPCCMDDPFYHDGNCLFLVGDFHRFVGSSVLSVQGPGNLLCSFQLQLAGLEGQLAVNFLWPFFFFGAGWYGFAFLWLIFLWGLVYGCIRTFGKFSRNAAYLMIPYLAWLTFAGYLNLFIALWN
mgnify:CR=1 FL=1